MTETESIQLRHWTCSWMNEKIEDASTLARGSQKMPPDQPPCILIL